MANTKDYAMREMIYDQCFSTGEEFTGQQLLDIVNRRLKQRDMKLIQSRTTLKQDLDEMNGKFFRMYGKDCIAYEDRHKKRYYRYAYGVKSIYNRQLTQDELEKLQEARNLLLGFKGLPDFGWIDQMMTRLDQNIIGKQKLVASFEGGTKRDREYLMILFNDILNREVLDVDYRPFFGDSESITIHPYYLKQYWRRWYLFAKKEGGTEIEAFSLDCMESIAINNTVKYKGTKTSFNKYFKDMVGVTMPPETDVEHIELWADASIVPYLLAMPIHESQKIRIDDEKNCTVMLDVMINHELIQELMYYGELLAVKSPLHFRDEMMEKFEWVKNSYKNASEGNASFEGMEPLLFSFNYIHEDKNDWKNVHFRICLGPKILDATMTDYQNDWGYIRTCLERIVGYGRTVIELYDSNEPTKIDLKKAGEILDIKVTPNRHASKDKIPFSGWARSKDVVRELYQGLLECAKAFPKDYVDGCPFTYDVVYKEMKSEIIENYLKEA